MASEHVKARDLRIGDEVRMLDAVWQVTNLTKCGNEEIEILLLKSDGTDQLVNTMDPDDLIERLR